MVLLLAAALLLLVAWRVETPWRRAQATYFDRVLETSRAELAVKRAELADDLRFLEGEVEVTRDRLPAGAVAESEQRLLDLERKLRRASAKDPSGREAEGFRELVENERRTLDDLRSDVAEAERELAVAREPVERLEERIDSLDGVLGRLRGVPVLRAFGAGVGLRSIRPSTAGAETTAAKNPAERCVTCHLGMATPAVSYAPNSVLQSGAPEHWSRLWAPHSSPDLYLSSESPHSVEEIGCVACHGGDGLATDIVAAGHRPRDEEAENRWRREWGWRTPAPSQAPKPIVTGARVESSCASCHDAPWLRGAPTLEAGRLLARSMGCVGCHETGREDFVATAPSLQDLPRRKRPEWVRAFLADPSAWKPTFMPHFWDDAPVEERDAEVAAVVEWLWSGEEGNAEAGSGSAEGERSTIERTDSSGGDGGAAGGRRLWSDLGCGACHLVEPGRRREGLLGSQRLRGPSLAALGSEASRDAIVRSLERHEPTYVWRAAEVPALASYLSSLTRPLDQAEGAVPDAVVPDAIRDELLRIRLLEVTTHEDAATWIDRLDHTRRTLLLGYLAIERYRCGSCHLLPRPPSLGFDSLKAAEKAPVAEPRSLVAVGERFAGPSATIWPGTDWPGTVWSSSVWLETAGPENDAASVWPHSRSGAGLPSWRLSPREAEALAVQLAGWRASTRPARDTVEAGRDAIARHGCRACHRLDVDGPVDFFAGRAEAPPSLADAGEKLRADWIFRHLDDPRGTAQRPWSALRMPRFELADEERSAIAVFFASRAGVPAFSSAFSSSTGAPSPAARALGEAVFQVLICDGCHGPEAAVRAPEYGDSGERLRWDWLRRWLLDPHASAGMPPPFPPRAGRPDATYLLATLDAPMFSVQRSRLERFFLGRESLEDAFEDADAVADALALHVLTLDE